MKKKLKSCKNRKVGLKLYRYFFLVVSRENGFWEKLFHVKLSLLKFVIFLIWSVCLEASEAGEWRFYTIC